MRVVPDVVLNGQCVEKGGEVTVGKFNVDDRADDLNDFTDVGGGGGSGNHKEFLRIKDGGENEYRGRESRAASKTGGIN